MADAAADVPEEDLLDACCGRCGSGFHSTANHPTSGVTTRGTENAPPDDFPPGYDPAEADRLIGRDPSG